ncbi:MAG: DUF4920 domain-containing protein [Cyclobacteriaceae bacterium]
MAGCANPESNYLPFGEEITAVESKSIVEVGQLLAGQDSIVVKLTGTVDEVCQAKGCWMTLSNASGDPVRVTFKDYGFFVPKDIAGKEVIVEGVIRKDVLSEKMARHYAEDAGEAFDSTKVYNEFAFVANGVLVSKN